MHMWCPATRAGSPESLVQAHAVRELAAVASKAPVDVVAAMVRAGGLSWLVRPGGVMDSLRSELTAAAATAAESSKAAAVLDAQDGKGDDASGTLHSHSHRRDAPAHD